MSRLAEQQYLQAHRFLRAVWLESEGDFTLLSAQDQWYLHDFFRPSDELSPEALLQHRKMVSAKRPSLPQCAGRALARLQVGLDAPELVRVQVAIGSRKRHKVEHIRASAMVRPVPDYDKLVRVLLGLGDQQLLKMSQKQQSDSKS